MTRTSKIWLCFVLISVGLIGIFVPPIIFMIMGSKELYMAWMLGALLPFLICFLVGMQILPESKEAEEKAMRFVRELIEGMSRFSNSK